MLEEFLAKAAEYTNSIFSQLFVNLIVAIVILLIGFILGRVAGRLAQNFLHEIEINKILKKRGINLSLEQILSHLLTYSIYAVTIIWALYKVGLAKIVLTLIAAAALILLLISVLLAIKDFMPNAVAGFFIYQRGLVKEGDSMRFGKLEGKVKRVGLVETEMKTKRGDSLHIPNSMLVKKALLIRRN